MMYPRLIVRLLHVQRPCYAAEKSLLATLRKKTGYTFANCKKALEMHNHDLIQAEKWLKQQAQALGWSKATKLEGRQTLQGLIAVAVRDKNGTMVEVNCETDFVARNKEFHKIAREAASSCLQFLERQPPSDGPVKKISLNTEQLKTLPARDGKSLADHLALMIGTVGENASLRRALCVKVTPNDDENLSLSGYAHPSQQSSENDGTSTNVMLGRLGGLVVLKRLGPPAAAAAAAAAPSSEEKEGDVAVDLDTIGRDICRHVVGMNPQKIGTDEDEPEKDREEETCLIHQEYLLDDSVTVSEVLNENNVQVIEFQRFECGENIPTPADQSLEYVETCQ